MAHSLLCVCICLSICVSISIFTSLPLVLALLEGVHASSPRVGGVFYLTESRQLTCSVLTQL